MFSKINKLERLLCRLSEELDKTKTKRYTANQILKAQDIHLADNASLVINMNNMIFSVEIVNECLEIIGEIKPFLPNIKDGNSLQDCLNFYKNTLITKALDKTGGDRQKAGNLLGLTDRQMRYQINKEKTQ